MRPPPIKGQIVTIAMLLAALIVLVLFRDRCGQGIGNMFQALDVPAGDGGRPSSVGPLDGGSRG